MRQGYDQQHDVINPNPLQALLDFTHFLNPCPSIITVIIFLPKKKESALLVELELSNKSSQKFNSLA